MRTKTHTLVIDRQDGQPLKYTLYDNVNDPYQMKNVADENKPIIKLIKEELIPWLEKPVILGDQQSLLQRQQIN